MFLFNTKMTIYAELNTFYSVPVNLQMIVFQCCPRGITYMKVMFILSDFKMLSKKAVIHTYIGGIAFNYLSIFMYYMLS